MKERGSTWGLARAGALGGRWPIGTRAGGPPPRGTRGVGFLLAEGGGPAGGCVNLRGQRCGGGGGRRGKSALTPAVPEGSERRERWKGGAEIWAPTSILRRKNNERSPLSVPSLLGGVPCHP